MTYVQNLSNFFNRVWLQHPDAVIVDEAARHISRLHDTTETRSVYDTTLPDYERLPDIPDFRRKGVCTYTPETGEVLFAQDADTESLDPVNHAELATFLEETVNPETVRELYVDVDIFNGFTATVPDRDYCETTDFTRFDDWLADHYDPEPGYVETSNTKYSELLDDILADDTDVVSTDEYENLPKLPVGDDVDVQDLHRAYLDASEYDEN